MKKLVSSDFLFMRLLVGYLGEKDQFNWWPTTFICSFSNLFLSPVFPRTTLLSQYHGILEAARRLHDERIGVGSVFHLFRLQEVHEQELHGILSDDGPSLSMESFASMDSALSALQKIADGDTSASEGPETSLKQIGPWQLGVAEHPGKRAYTIGAQPHSRERCPA